MSDPFGATVFRKTLLAPGIYFVATPIGSARDITLRGLDILASAEVIAAEDTRTARRLMELHGVPVDGRRMIAYHDHSSASARDGLLKLAAESSVAYVSEAGTPLVADPGFQLGRAAAEQGIAVTTAPGPSAALAALTLSGLPSDRFTFAGFPPHAGASRKRFLEGLAGSDGTVILFESPKRIKGTLTELCEIAGADRPAALARELTKKFEEVRRGTLSELLKSVNDAPPKGEIVLLIGRADVQEADPEAIDEALRAAMAGMRVKDAAAEVAEIFGKPRREMYQRALELGRENGSD